MNKILSVAVFVILLTNLMLVTACTSDAGLLEDKIDQVELTLEINSSYHYETQEGYLYPKEEFDIFVKAIDKNKLPQQTTYVWNVIQTTGGNLIYDLEQQHAKAVSSIVHKPISLIDEGTYTIRVDLYDTKEYEISGVLAPRWGTVEKHVTVKALETEVKAELIGEGKYRFTPRIVNPEIYPVNWGYQFDFGDGNKEYLRIDENDSITHEYKKEGIYPVIIETMIAQDDTIATTKLSVSVIGSEFFIEGPSTSLKVGQEYTFRAMTSGLLPASPSYEWYFGDGNGLVIPFSNEATHIYAKEGTYTVNVKVFESDEEAAPLLGVATTEVTIEPSTVDFLDSLRQTNWIEIGLVCPIITTYGSHDAWHSEWAEDNSLGIIQWEGSHFSVTWSSGRHSEVISGDVRQEGSELYVSLKARHEFDKDTDIAFWEIEISELPLSTYKLVEYGEVRFEGRKLDSDVPQYVTYFNMNDLISVDWSSDLSLNVVFDRKTD